MRTAIYPPHTLPCTRCTYQGCLESDTAEHCACYHDDRRHICCFCEAGLAISPTSMR